MKPSVRSLFVGVAVAFFFTLTLAALAEEKSSPPPAATPPADPAAPAATPPATPAVPAPEPSTTPAPAAVPATEATPLRRLDTPASTEAVQVEKADDDVPAKAKKKSRSQIIRERADETRRRAEARQSTSVGEPIVNVMADSHLPADRKADAVVAVFGSAIVEGEVGDSVVAVFGDNRITGPGVHGEAVAVFGDSYIDSPVDGEVVVIFGNLEFGPNARIEGEVVCVAGTVKRDPSAVLKSGVKNIVSTKMPSLRAWFDQCLRKIRPLAFGPNLGWAWGIAFGFLALYVFGALLFRTGAERCVKIMETRPGFSVLTALLVTLITPILIVLLAMTGIGVAAIPFIGLGLICVSLFGKMVVLAWLGRRFTRFFGDGPLGHIAFAVLVGGLIVMALYTIPIFGYALFQFIGWIGMGVVTYTIVSSMKREKVATATPFVPATAAAASYAAPGFAPGAVTPPAATPTTSGGYVGAAAVPIAAAPESVASSIPGEPGVVPPVDVPPLAVPPPMRSFTPPPVSPPVSGSTLPRAGFWIRLAAMAIDMILIGVIVGGIMHGKDAMFVVVAAYAAAMWRYKGTTIGGIICGLKVVRIDDRSIDWPTAVVRALACFLSMAVMGLGFIWVVFDRDKQSWHDKIAGTTVVRMPKGVSLL
jgi:uncharacterized RDD family membrane protein YckC